MKRFRKLRHVRCTTALILAGSVASLVTVCPVRAANQTWDGGSLVDGIWSTVADWVGDSAAPGATSGTASTDVATFNSFVNNIWGISATSPIGIDANRNIFGITFTGATGSYFIGATGGNALKLSSGGSTQITNALTGTNVIETINASLEIEGSNGTYSLTNNSFNGTGVGDGTLNIGGGITGGAAGTTVLTLNGSNTNANSVSGVVANGSATSLAVVKGGTGTWMLSGANTYSGGTTLSAGTLTVRAGSALGSGAMTVGANAVFNYAAAADAPLTIGGALTINTGAATVLGGTIGSTTTSARIAASGAATAAGAIKVNVFGLNGVTPLAGTNSYTLIHGGAGSLLSVATYSLGLVFNNANFTVGTPSVTATDLTVPVTSAAGLTTAYWKGGLTGATSTWAASNGSTQSNWVATAGGPDQPLVPGAGTDVIFSNSTVNTSPSSTTLGSDMTIRSLTQQDSVNTVGLYADTYSLTITPANQATGITMASSARDLTINANLVLGAAQTWTNNSSTGYLTVNSNVANGANTLTVSGFFINIFGALGGGSGGLTMGSGQLNLMGGNTYTGATTINGGVILLTNMGSIGASTSITVNNNGELYLGSSANTASLNRVGDSIPIFSNGGSIVDNNTAVSGAAYSESIGVLAINNGATKVTLNTNMLGGSNTQKLTLGGLSQANTATVSFIVTNVGPNATSDIIQVAGMTQTAAGQIIAPWATTNTDSGIFGTADYAVYDGAGRILPAGLAASAENTWATGANVTLASGSTSTLTAARTLNSLRSTGNGGTLALGAFNLETFGILGSGLGLQITSTTGVVRQPGTSPANLYVTAATSSVSISAPIQDHTGALTLVASGPSKLVLSGANSFTGGVVLNAGTLRLDSNTALGTGPLTIFSGTLDSTTSFANANANALILNGDFTSDATTLIDLGVGPVSLGTAIGSARTVTVANSSLTLGGVISNGTTANAIIKAGGGTLVLAGVNTYTGGTTVNGSASFGPGTLVARSGSALGTGSVIVNSNGILTYAPVTDAPLSIGGNLSVTGGTSTALGGALGSTATSAQIAVAGAAIATGAVKVNLRATPGATVLPGTNIYTLVHGGAGSNLNGATYSMGVVYNNTNFTIGAPTASATDLTMTVTGGLAPLTTAYWTGGLSSVWAASNGSTQSNWAATPGGPSQPLVPGAGADLIFTNSNLSSSTLGADMTVRSITAQAASIYLDDDGSTLTISPASGNTGINITGGSTGLTINSKIVLGSPQTWVNNSSVGNLSVNGNVTNGGNLLTINTASDSATVEGAISGTGGLTKAGASSLILSGANTYTGVTTVNGGTLLVEYFASQGSISASSAVVLNNNAILTIGNFASPAGGNYNDRLGDNIPMTSNGGTFNFNNSVSSSGSVFSETVGALALANGQTWVELSSDMATGANQTLTIRGLSQANAATVNFTGPNAGLNTTSNVIQVAGATQTAPGQIIGPWATIGSGGGSDYAVYDAAGRIVPAGIAASTEDTWASGTNVTLATGTTLTGTRSINSLRFTGNGTLNLGANNLETFGVLGGNFAFLTISSSSGAVRQPGIQPASLYVTGNDGITISAPIRDNIGALTLVISGSAVTLSGQNSFSGGVVFNSGTLELDSGTALGTGPLSIYGGTLTTKVSFANANANPINIDGDFAMDSLSGTINLGTGPITLGNLAGTTTININTISGGMLIMGGAISDGSTSSALIKAGIGAMMLTGASTYSGGTTLASSQAFNPPSTLTVRNGSGLGTGSVTVGTNTVLNYAAMADTPLHVGGALTIIGGKASNGDKYTGLGGSIGATATSAEIAVAGAATATDVININVFAAPGVTPQAGTTTYTLVHGGAGSSLAGATYSLTVFGNTNFTVGGLTATATDITVSVTGGLTPLTTAYWKGGVNGATAVWSASDGSTQSNWVATSGGGNQPLAPGATTDLIFSNSTVTTSPTGSTLGADMTIRSITQQDSSRVLTLNTDGFTLTIAPSDPKTGFNILSSAQGATINPNVVLGASQTWTNNSSAGFFLNGNVSNGANSLTVTGTGNTTISGILGGGSGGLTKTGGGTLSLTGINSYTGATTISGGALLIGSGIYNGSTGTLFIGTGSPASIISSSAVSLSNNAVLILANASTDSAVNRLGDATPIASNGSTIQYANSSSSGVVYAETTGAVTVANGQTNVVLTNNQSGTGGNMQTLSLGGLNQTNAATITFSAPTAGLNTTTNIVQVSGAAQTAAGQIAGPWATTGTSAGAATDYAVYDAAARILPAGIAATAENTWTTVADVTLNSAATLTGTRTVNSLRYTGSTNTLALGANNLETLGILNGNSGTLSISSTSGVIQQTGTAPANLYITAGSGPIAISAPIQDNAGALTVVKSGASSLALSGPNSFSGGVVLNAGLLELDSATALGTGSLTIFGGTLTTASSFANANNNAVVINGDFTTSASVSLNLGLGPVSLGSTVGTARTITAGGSLSVGGVISDGTTANAIVKAGAGNLVFTGANAYTGGTTVNAGTLTARNSGALGSGDVAVGAGATLNYAAVTDVPLNIGGVLTITGGSGTGLGASLGATTTSAQISVNGAATATGTVKLSVAVVPGATLLAGTNSYTLVHGGASSGLDGATYTFALLNNTNFTVGPATATPTDLTIPVTSATPLSTAYWKGGLGGATATWAASNGSTQSNWVASSGGANQALVPGSGADLIFSNSTVTTSPASSTLGADMTVRSITQQDSSRAVGLNADGSTLTIAPSTSTTGITITSGALSVTINPTIILGAAQTWTNNSAGATLTVAGNVSNGANLLTVSGTNNTTISGAILGGSGGLTKSGAGTLTLTGANLYTGTTTVTAGTLAEGSTGSIADSSNLTVNGATAIFSLGASHSEVVGSVTLQGGGSITGTGTSALTASTGQTFEMQAGSVTAILAGAGIALNKTTSGTVTLSGSNTYTGTTTVTAGTLAEGSTGFIANTSNLTVNGATAIFDLGASHSDTVGTVTLQGGGSITGSGTSALTASSGQTFEMQSGSVTAILAGATIALNKTTSATVTLSGANTYTGATTVTAGTLAEGASGFIADSSNLTVNGAGAIFSLGVNHSDTVGTVTLQSGTISGTGTSTLTASSGHTFEMQSGSVSAILAGTGIALNKTTSGTITLSGANTYTGLTTITGGSLTEGSTGSIADSSNLNINGGSFNLGLNHSDTVGTVTLQGGSIVGTGTSVLSASPGQTFEMQSGSVSAILGGTDIPLNKSTSGTVTLSRVNTYTGATSVTGGILLVGGSIAGSVTTVTNAGSTLGGTGTVGDVTVGSGAVLQGGNGTLASGTLSSGGAVSLGDGSTIQLTLGSSGTHSSLANAGGTWSFDNDQAFAFNILPGASATTYDNIIGGLSGSEAGLDTIGSWVITTPGVAGTFSYDGTGGVDLTLSVVPEAGPAALLLAGVSLLGLRRWRSRRESR